MKRLLLALLLLAGPAAFAAPFALTNTRYSEAPAETAALTTNGHYAFALWKSPTTINITRIVDGEHRIGRPVFSSGDWPGLVWTGQYFLAVAASGGNIVGRVLDANGDPLGGAFTIVENGSGPRVAWNGKNVLLVYARETSVIATLLTGTGAPASGGKVTLATNAAYDVASNGNGFAAVTASPSEVRITTLTAGGAIAAQRTAWTFGVAETPRTVAIASDGSGYLAIGSMRGLIDAVGVEGDGTLGVPFRIGRLESGERVDQAAIAWDGSGYTAGIIGGALDGRLLVARVSSHSVHSLSEGPPASRSAAVGVAALGERVLMTWQNAPGQPLLLANATEPENAVPVTFAATHQELGAAVSSKSATLVAWTEVLGNVRTLRAGVRGEDGSWVERRIGDGEEALRAASDGVNFLLLTGSPQGVSAVLLDPQANVLSRLPWLVPLSAPEETSVDVASNGDDYAIAYVNDQRQPVLIRVKRNGASSPPLLLPLVNPSAEGISVASAGTGFLVTWNDIRATFCYPFCDLTQERVLAMRVDPDFAMADTAPLVLADDDAWLVGSAARHGQYEVYWATPDELTVQFVVATGPGDLSSKFDLPETGDLARRWESLRVVSSEENWLGIWPRRFGAEPTRFFESWMAFPKNIATPFEARELIAMPDGRQAWVGVDEQEAAPHHGALRLMLDVPDSDAPVPDAPRATLAYDGREMKIEWTAPRQPVAGYRVEYRVGDGSWNELPRQYGVSERSATWTSIVRGKSYAFRVRAFGENGPGAYSEPVQASTAAGGKRRSVR